MSYCSRQQLLMCIQELPHLSSVRLLTTTIYIYIYLYSHSLKLTRYQVFTKTQYRVPVWFHSILRVPVLQYMSLSFTDPSVKSKFVCYDLTYSGFSICFSKCLFFPPHLLRNNRSYKSLTIVFNLNVSCCENIGFLMDTRFESHIISNLLNGHFTFRRKIDGTNWFHEFIPLWNGIYNVYYIDLYWVLIFFTWVWKF